MEKIIIRSEERSDFRKVEELTREAFWNLHHPGCDEHYLVHVLREHEDFIPELDFVAELDGDVVGNVMYTKAKLVDEKGVEKEILTFGPISVHPNFQRNGVGKALLEHSFSKAVQMGYDTIVIFGHPGNYVSRGFVSCHKKNICMEGDLFPTAMLVKELKPGSLDGRKWFYHESAAYDLDPQLAEEYDHIFPAKIKSYQTSQEEFYIYSHSLINSKNE